MLSKYTTLATKIVPATLLLALSFTSCKSWDEPDQQAWKQACMENATKWAADEANAKTYCDCVLEKMMKKYPNVNDALEHVQELSTDTAFYYCKLGVKVK